MTRNLNPAATMEKGVRRMAKWCGEGCVRRMGDGGRNNVAAPQRCERACQLTTRVLALRVGSAIHLSMQRSEKAATPKMPPHRAYSDPARPYKPARSPSSSYSEPPIETPSSTWQ